MVTAVAWALWKQRNARVFGRSDTLDVFGVTEAIFHELAIWMQAGATGVEHVVE